MSDLTGIDLRKSGGRLKRKRMVMATVCKHSQGKRGVKRWAFSYADLAALFGMTEGSVRNLIASDSDLDPEDLQSVCENWLKRRSNVL